MPSSASAGISGAGENTGNLSASASSSFQDLVTISEPTLNGTIGTVSVRLRGEFRVLGLSRGYLSSAAVGQWSASFGSGGETAQFQDLFGQGRPDLNVIDIPYYRPNELTGNFIFGQPFFVGLAAFSSVSLSTQPNGQFASIGHSLGFDGIAEIRDADGNLVPFGAYSVSPPEFGNSLSLFATVSSASGADYTISHALPSIEVIPEPASAAVLMLGTAALLIRRRGARLASCPRTDQPTRARLS